ncbi:hypothetical protein [Evansella tamaricis]|nr:hypothetical protein [Evansella tamaricis]
MLKKWLSGIKKEQDKKNDSCCNVQIKEVEKGEDCCSTEKK